MLNAAVELAGLGWRRRAGFPTDSDGSIVDGDLNALRFRSGERIVNIVAVCGLIQVKWPVEAAHHFANTVRAERQSLAHEAIDIAQVHEFFHGGVKLH